MNEKNASTPSTPLDPHAERISALVAELLPLLLRSGQSTATVFEALIAVYEQLVWWIALGPHRAELRMRQGAVKFAANEAERSLVHGLNQVRRDLEVRGMDAVKEFQQRHPDFLKYMAELVPPRSILV